MVLDHMLEPPLHIAPQHAISLRWRDYQHFVKLFQNESLTLTLL